MRKETATQEDQLKTANNLKKIRNLSKHHPNIRAEIADCLQQPKILLSSQFKRCQLKGENFQVFQLPQKTTSKAWLHKIDPDFDLDMLMNTSKPRKISKKLKNFLDSHTRKDHYLFSIKKCKQEECVCGSPRTTPDV
jgi:hypothetical protein